MQATTQPLRDHATRSGVSCTAGTQPQHLPQRPLRPRPCRRSLACRAAPEDQKTKPPAKGGDYGEHVEDDPRYNRSASDRRLGRHQEPLCARTHCSDCGFAMKATPAQDISYTLDLIRVWFPAAHAVTLPRHRVDLSEQHAYEARQALLQNAARGEARMNLAQAAFQVAAEDDAIASHTVVPLPVGACPKHSEPNDHMTKLHSTNPEFQTLDTCQGIQLPNQVVDACAGGRLSAAPREDGQ